MNIPMKTRSLRHAGAPLLSTVVLLGAALGSASMGGCYVEPASPLPQPPQTAVSGPEAPAPPIAPPAPPQPEIIVEEPPAPPPPPPPEPAPPAPPSPGNLWVAGNYTWNGGHYEWARGHYERPPRPNARHVPGHWEARARGRAWVGPHWE